jgi:hypothetical protein
LRPNDAVRKDRLLPSGVVLGKGFALRTKKETGPNYNDMR